MKIEANAIKRGQRLLADYAEREHFRADAVWSIKERPNFGRFFIILVFPVFLVYPVNFQFSIFNFPFHQYMGITEPQ